MCVCVCDNGVCESRLLPVYDSRLLPVCGSAGPSRLLPVCDGVRDSRLLPVCGKGSLELGAQEKCPHYPF